MKLTFQYVKTMKCMRGGHYVYYVKNFTIQMNHGKLTKMLTNGGIWMIKVIFYVKTDILDIIFIPVMMIQLEKSCRK